MIFYAPTPSTSRTSPTAVACSAWSQSLSGRGRRGTAPAPSSGGQFNNKNCSHFGLRFLYDSVTYENYVTSHLKIGGSPMKTTYVNYSVLSVHIISSQNWSHLIFQAKTQADFFSLLNLPPAPVRSPLRCPVGTRLRRCPLRKRPASRLPHPRWPGAGALLKARYSDDQILWQITYCDSYNVQYMVIVCDKLFSIPYSATISDYSTVSASLLIC